jgi:hypothetical protein
MTVSISEKLLVLDEKDKTLLKNEKLEALRIMLILIVALGFSIYLYALKWASQGESIITVLVLTAVTSMLIGVIYSSKLYFQYQTDLIQNVKIQKIGVLQSKGSSQSKSKTVLMINDNKFTLPYSTEALLSGKYDYIQEGNRVVYSYAPQSKYLLAISHSE